MHIAGLPSLCGLSTPASRRPAARQCGRVLLHFSGKFSPHHAYRHLGECRPSSRGLGQFCRLLRLWVAARSLWGARWAWLWRNYYACQGSCHFGFGQGEEHASDGGSSNGENGCYFGLKPRGSRGWRAVWRGSLQEGSLCGVTYHVDYLTMGQHPKQDLQQNMLGVVPLSSQAGPG